MEIIVMLLIGLSCSVGQPIDDFSAWTAAHNYDYGRTIQTVRIGTHDGPVNIWHFEKLMFVTRPGSQHGMCARDITHE